jgi:Kef-type K+ transport system membrane component KefB
MNPLFSLGLILLLALVAGRVAHHLRVPEVTGYIAAGVLVGPSVLGWVNHENLSALSVFSEVALGLILFSIGSVFEFGRVRRLGPAVLRVTAAESVLAGLAVCGGMLLFGQPWQVAALLGAVAMETGAASTMMVIRECDATGPLSDMLTGVIGVNNILCLIAFTLASSALDLSAHLQTGGALDAVYRSVYPLVWQLIGSAALGYLVGVLLACWGPKVVEHGETLILLVGCLLLCVGASILLELSSLVASLAVGATMANLSPDSRRLFSALSRSDPPFYAIFFVIAGADLNLGLLKTIGALGMAYVICRAAGKLFGARWGARMAGLDHRLQNLLGFGLMAHAGLAVGLTLTISRRFPDYAPAVITVVLAAVAVYEVAGPISARLTIIRSGEARPRSFQRLAAGN